MNESGWVLVRMTPEEQEETPIFPFIPVGGIPCPMPPDTTWPDRETVPLSLDDLLMLVVMITRAGLTVPGLERPYYRYGRRSDTEDV